MQIGMTLPVMEPGLDAATLEAWCRAIDGGPFSSLCFGERMAFDNPDALTLLGAVAAWTQRVRIVMTVVVPQLHDPVMLAKALATGDLLCNGRLTVGLGVGGREEDYRAVGAELSTRTMADLAERALLLKQVWRGERVVDAVLPIGPLPVQAGGPPLLVGTMGPRTTRSAAQWADGLAGVFMEPDLAAVSAQYDLARDAWRQAGKPAPTLMTSTWFALDGGDGSGRAQVHQHLRHYMNWLPPDLVDALADTTGFAGTEVELAALLEQLAALGTDELHLIPTSGDLAQVHRVAALLTT